MFQKTIGNYSELVLVLFSKLKAPVFVKLNGV